MNRKKRHPIAFRKRRDTGEVVGVMLRGLALQVYRTSNDAMDHRTQWLKDNTTEATKEEYTPLLTALRTVFSDCELHVVKNIPTIKKQEPSCETDKNN